MTNKETKSHILKLAKAIKKEFAQVMPKDSTLVAIEWGLPTLAVNLPNGKEYFFQGEETGNMLEEAVAISNKFNVSVEDAIIYLAESWG